MARRAQRVGMRAVAETNGTFGTFRRFKFLLSQWYLDISPGCNILDQPCAARALHSIYTRLQPENVCSIFSYHMCICPYAGQGAPRGRYARLWPKRMVPLAPFAGKCWSVSLDSSQHQSNEHPWGHRSCSGVTLGSSEPISGNPGLIGADQWVTLGRGVCLEEQQESQSVIGGGFRKRMTSNSPRQQVVPGAPLIVPDIRPDT